MYGTLLVNLSIGKNAHGFECYIHTKHLFEFGVLYGIV